MRARRTVDAGSVARSDALDAHAEALGHVHAGEDRARRPPGTAARVSRLTTIMSRTRAARSGRRVAEQRRGPAAERSSSMPPATASVAAAPDSAPPTTSPQRRPTAVRPRHQMPSTSSGQNVDAATAKASPTLRDSSRRRGRQRQRERHQPADHGGHPEVADPTAQHVGGQHPGDADQQPRRGGQERGERAGGHQRRRAVGRPGPAERRAGQQQHHGVGGAGDQQLRDVEPREHAEQRREQVEQPTAARARPAWCAGPPARRGWCRSAPARAAGPWCRGTWRGSAKYLVERMCTAEPAAGSEPLVAGRRARRPPPGSPHRRRASAWCLRPACARRRR